MRNKHGELLVWWIAQVPMTRFDVPVASVREAAKILDTLAKYDLFLLQQEIRLDYTNAGGLLFFSDRCGWTDWYDQDARTIDEIPESELDRVVSIDL